MISAERGTIEFARDSFVMGLFFSVPVTLLLILPILSIYFPLLFFLLGKKLKRWWLITMLLLPSFLLFLYCLVSAWSGTDVRNRFKRHVIEPIPASAENIRVAGYQGLLTHFWIVKLTIANNDLQSIITNNDLHESQPFDMQKIVQGNRELKKVKWTSEIPTNGNRSFYKTIGNENDVPESLMFLMHDRNTLETWFLYNYQN